MHSTVSNEGMIWPKMCSSRYRYCLEEKMKGGMGQGSRDTLMDGLLPTDRILHTLSLNSWARAFTSSYHPLYYTFFLHFHSH